LSISSSRHSARVFAPANLPQAQTHWVERWIARDEMLHVPINAKESDARGRGEPKLWKCGGAIARAAPEKQNSANGHCSKRYL